jgi:ubiquinone/menaquinone biosynthesis C-methylase UbiE
MSSALQRFSYTLFAPWYDLAIASATRGARSASLARLDPARERQVLLCGAGSGLDLPHLPAATTFTALDLTPAMIRRARDRATANHRSGSFVIGDATALPFQTAAFDAVVLHLILAVVPRPDRALAEAARVLRPGGRALVFDKFLRPGERAPLRRLANHMLAPFLTRMDVVFEEQLPAAPDLHVTADTPALLGGWFRFITLLKSGAS